MYDAICVCQHDVSLHFPFFPYQDALNVTSRKAQSVCKKSSVHFTLLGFVYVIVLAVYVITRSAGEDCDSTGEYAPGNSQRAMKSGRRSKVELLPLTAFCESDDKRKRFPVGDNQNVRVAELPADTVNSVERFVFFVGYPRSGHSIVGSLLDAHPNMIVSNGFGLFSKLKEDPAYEDPSRDYLYNALYRSSVCSYYFGLRAQEASKKGYTLHVADSWQGRYDGKILVIGDKNGGNTAMTYFNNGHRSFLKQYKKLLSIVKVPTIAFHVVRNPFDNIATMAIRSSKSDVSIFDLTPDHQYKNKEMLDSTITSYFSRVQTVSTMIKELDLTVIEVHIQDLIKKPKKTFSMICQRLQVPCSRQFLQLVANKTFNETPRTRVLIAWTPDQIKTVMKEMQKHSFLQRYTFDN